MRALDFGGTKLWTFRTGRLGVPAYGDASRAPSPLVDPAEHVPTLGYSGGKDSTALACAATKAGIKFTGIYADTGWELLGHLIFENDRPARVVVDPKGENVVLAYARWVSSYLGFPLHVVGREGGMVAAIKSKGMPRVGLQKFCSRELKVVPKFDFLRANHGEDLSHVMDMIGIRGDESTHRKTQPVTDVVNFDLNLVRPIHHWTVDDVLQAHHEMGVPINPIYRLGLDRVGCWPCVHASKNEIATIARLDPDRMQLIHELEEDVATRRPLGRARTTVAKNRSKKVLTEEEKVAREEKAASFGAKGPTFFSINRTFAPIDHVIQWARTTRGGKQLNILVDVDTEGGGCMRWGLCDAPVVAEDA